MKLSAFISVLKELESAGNGDLPVALEDWQEEYMHPSEGAGEKIIVKRTKYWPKDGDEMINGLIVVIGTSA